MTPRWMIIIMAVPIIAIGVYMNANWFWLPHLKPFTRNLEYYFLSDFVYSLLCLAAVGACMARAMLKSKDPKNVFWFGCVVFSMILMFYHFITIRVIGASIANATADSLRMLFVAGLMARLFIRTSNMKQRVAPATNKS